MRIYIRNAACNRWIQRRPKYTDNILHKIYRVYNIKTYQKHYGFGNTFIMQGGGWNSMIATMMDLRSNAVGNIVVHTRCYLNPSMRCFFEIYMMVFFLKIIVFHHELFLVLLAIIANSSVSSVTSGEITFLLLSLNF